MIQTFYRYSLATLLLLTIAAAQARNGDVHIAIVIDDLGNLHAEGLRTLELPGQISFAILPFTPYSTAFARLANSLGKDVLVHLPMQAHTNKSLGPGALRTAMDRHEIQRRVRAALHALPQARGLSNHMGSLLTEQVQPMAWLMQTLKQEKKLFFLDSRTTALTKAATEAKVYGLANTSRDVFLDNELDESVINQQFDLLLAKARLNGTAVAIGHPNPQTLNVLEARLPQLKAQGIVLVSLSKIIQIRHSQRLAITKPLTTDSTALAASVLPIGPGKQ